MLTDCIIPFWHGLKDYEFGGYFGYVNFELEIKKQSVKGCILNSRVLWFFSNAYKLLSQNALLEDANHAYRFLTEHCLDKKNGGLYWSVNYDGSVFDSTKHTYNQAFAIYALSAYYEAAGNHEALDLALRIFRLIEDRCADEAGYGESYDVAFIPSANEKLSENGVMADKTMNTLLHIFEAYSSLYKSSGSADVEKAMRRVLDIFELRVYNPAKHRQEVFFDKNMNSLIDMCSYGHDIEASWLIDYGVSLLHDRDLGARIGVITSDLAQNVFETAYHKRSLWNEQVNGTEDKHRIWWVQAEALVGFLNEYEKHPDKIEFRAAAMDILDYILQYIVDKRPGSEWFWRVNDNGNPDSSLPFVEPWKCPYHNGRMCFEILRRLATDNA
ncbi:MAG: AGE family epimerase/isomerase [Clostridiales bacterium]|nr:AGE family epimerase/isomerase [Clostridiales bacterium]